MQRTKKDGIRIPKYRRHVTGRAFVQLNGKRIYLGKHGSTESRERYERAVAEWLANGRTAAETHDEPNPDLSVDALVADYWKRVVQKKYNAPGSDGQRSRIKLAFRALRRLYGETRANEFGPRRLEIVREELMRPTERCPNGLSRREINARTSIVKAVFKWGVRQELVRADIWHRLNVVEGLRKGQCDVRDTPPVRPVPWADVEAVLPLLSRQVRALVLLQWWTGMRPSEACTIRTRNIDRTGNMWFYRPESHKTERFGRDREIVLGPKAQAVVAPFLKLDRDAYLFSPAEAERERREEQRRKRKTKVQPSQVERARLARARKLKQFADKYDKDTYRRAVHRACRRAGVEPWSPYRLRHSAGTRLRRELGIDAARVVLGHTSPAITEIYAEVDKAKAIAAMENHG